MPIQSILNRAPAWSVFLAAGLLPFAYAPFGILPAAFLAYGVFFYYAYHSDTMRSAARLGWVFSFGRFVAGLYWIGSAVLVEAESFWWLLPFAVIGFPAFLALIDAVALALWAKLRSRAPVADAILFCLVLAASEYTRAYVLTGFPWNAPVLIWAEWSWLSQSIALIGQHALNLVILLWLVVPLALVMQKRVIASIVSLVAVAGIAAAFGQWRMAQPSLPGDDLVVTLVQPHIEQGRKWSTEDRLSIMREVIDLTQEVLTDQTQMVVWPETAVPFLIDEEAFFPKLLAERIGSATNLVSGAVRREKRADGDYVYFNSMQLWSGSGQLLDTADKHNLVPFGEFLPLQGILEKLGFEQLTRQRGGFEAGPPNAELEDPTGQRFGAMICYEAIFPQAHKSGLRALINVTNDAWFGHTAGPYQHLAQARLRAIETGLPLVRAANTGISAAFDGLGRSLGEIALGKRDTITVRLPQPQTNLTNTSGHAIFATMFIICLVCYILLVIMRKKTKN